MSLRLFLGFQLHEKTPDHSSFTVWRDVCRWRLQHGLPAYPLHCTSHGLIDAYATGVDSTTFAINAISLE